MLPFTQVACIAIYPMIMLACIKQTPSEELQYSKPQHSAPLPQQSSHLNVNALQQNKLLPT